MKITCIRAFNEHGLSIMPGVVEVSPQIADYLLTNFPAYFVAAGPAKTPDSSSPSASDLVTPGQATAPEGADKDLEQPPADKMLRRAPKRKRL